MRTQLGYHTEQLVFSVHKHILILYSVIAYSSESWFFFSRKLALVYFTKGLKSFVCLPGRKYFRIMLCKDLTYSLMMILFYTDYPSQWPRREDFGYCETPTQTHMLHSLDSNCTGGLGRHAAPRGRWLILYAGVQTQQIWYTHGKKVRHWSVGMFLGKCICFVLKCTDYTKSLWRVQYMESTVYIYNTLTHTLTTDTWYCIFLAR